MSGHPTACREHMPFKGHRTCAEWGPFLVDRFMDEVAEHADVARAAKAVGQSVMWGERMIREYYAEEAD